VKNEQPMQDKKTKQKQTHQVTQIKKGSLYMSTSDS
jgi:hypothetical protein